MPISDHLFCASDDGALYDTRLPEWSGKPPLRANFSRHHGTIRDTADLKACLRAGAFAFPGGYPLYFVADDGESLSFEAVRANLRNVLDSISGNHRDGWRVVAMATNWEDDELTCSHTGKPIPSAYGDDEETQGESSNV